MPLTQTHTSDCLYKDLIIAYSLSFTSYSSSSANSLSLETRHMLFQYLQSMYIPLWYIPTISQKLAEGKRFGPWWICQDEIRIVHPIVEVRLFHDISFRGILHRPFQEDLIKKYPCS